MFGEVIESQSSVVFLRHSAYSAITENALQTSSLYSKLQTLQKYAQSGCVDFEAM